MSTVYELSPNMAEEEGQLAPAPATGGLTK
jgi:hypothetical protein